MADSKLDVPFANRIIINARGLEFKVRPTVFINRYGKTELEQNRVINTMSKYYKISLEECYTKILTTSFYGECDDTFKNEIIFPLAFITEFRFEDVQDFIDYHCGYYDYKKSVLDAIHTIITIDDDSLLPTDHQIIKKKYSDQFTNIKKAWSKGIHIDVGSTLLKLLNSGESFNFANLYINSISAFRNLHSYFFGNKISPPFLLESANPKYKALYSTPLFTSGTGTGTNVKTIMFSVRGNDIPIPMQLFEQSTKKAIQYIVKESKDNTIHNVKIHVDCKLSDFGILIDYLCGYNHELIRNRMPKIVIRLMEDFGIKHVKLDIRLNEMNSMQRKLDKYENT
jgi:hypothetical protein